MMDFKPRSTMVALDDDDYFQAQFERAWRFWQSSFESGNIDGWRLGCDALFEHRRNSEERKS